MVAQKLTESMGQTFVVDNRPAVDGVVGSETVAKSAPDGYTLILVSSSHAINPCTAQEPALRHSQRFSRRITQNGHPAVAAGHAYVGSSEERQGADCTAQSRTCQI
jgi:hypothetical protein